MFEHRNLLEIARDMFKTPLVAFWGARTPGREMHFARVYLVSQAGPYKNKNSRLTIR